MQSFPLFPHQHTLKVVVFARSMGWGPPSCPKDWGVCGRPHLLPSPGAPLGGCGVTDTESEGWGPPEPRFASLSWTAQCRAPWKPRASEHIPLLAAWSSCPTELWKESVFLIPVLDFRGPGSGSRGKTLKPRRAGRVPPAAQACGEASGCLRVPARDLCRLWWQLALCREIGGVATHEILSWREKGSRV